MLFIARYVSAPGAEYVSSTEAPRHAREEPTVTDCKMSLASDHRCTGTKEASPYPKIHLLFHWGGCHLLHRQHFRRVQEPDVSRIFHPQSPRWNFCHPVCRRPQLGHNHHEGCGQLGQIRSRHRPTIRLRPDWMGKPPGETFPDRSGYCPDDEQGRCSLEG